MDTTELKKTKNTLQTYMSRSRPDPCVQGPLSLCQVSTRERTSNMFMVQDIGFALKSTVTGALRFSENVVLNRMELLCHVRSTICHVRYYSAKNQFERFRCFLELISRFEFEFRRCENYIFRTIRIFGVFKVQSHTVWL